MKKELNKKFFLDFRACMRYCLTLFCIPLLALLLTTGSAIGQNKGTGKLISLKLDGVTLLQALEEINKLSANHVIFKKEEVVRETKKVTVNLKNVTVLQAVQVCLSDTRLICTERNGKVAVGPNNVVKLFTIAGAVTDEKKMQMPGVTVKLVGTMIGTATNTKGRFVIQLPVSQGMLEFSFVGYKTQRVNFSETRDTMRVMMKEDVQTLDEAVVVAYGTTTRRKSTGAVSVVKADEFKGIPSSNIANLLQGRVAGMDITNLSGAPGCGDVAITIRGYNSMDVEAGRRFSNPLWVIDGVPINSFTSPITGTNMLSDLNPDMIESIQVLKDASSAAIYGSRAANGVIIVTTKKGRQNQDASFSVNFSESWSVLPEFPALTTGRAERLLRLKIVQDNFLAYLDPKTNSYTYPTSLKEQYEHDRGSYNGFWYPNKNEISGGNGNLYQDSLNAFYNHSTNFFPIYFEMGKIMNANVQTYGGNERTTYGIGLGYYNETGVFKGTGFKRIDLNSNMTVIPVPRLSVDLRFNVSLVQKKRASSSADENLMMSKVVLPVETIPGEPYKLSSLLPGENSVVWDEVLKAYEGTREANRSIRLRTNFRLGYEVIEGLNLSTSFAADYAISRRNYFSPSYLANDKNSISLGETGINLMVLNENLLTYKKQIRENHHFDFVAGFSYQYDQEEYNGGSAKKSPSDKIYYAPSEMPSLGTVSWGDYTESVAYKNYRSDMQEKTLVSYFTRLEYNFGDKYSLSASMRWDGSSTFGRNNRWGTFPSVAVAWIFSEENLVKENFGWLSFGKLRASWGRSGMHFSSNYLALGIMNVGASYLGNGIIEPQWGDGLYNNKLSWEETDQYDFGLDLDLFNHRLGITLDYYYRYTDKLLDRVPLPSVGDYTGYRLQWRNAATVSNEGLELLVKYEIFREKDIYWKMSINASRNWNRFENSYTGKDQGGMRVIGKPLNGIYALKTIGYVNHQDEVPVFYDQMGICTPLHVEYGHAVFYKPGDYNVVDVDGDRVIIPWDGDLVYCGSALPEVTGGIVSEFRWRNFDVNLLLSFQLGRHMMEGTKCRALSSMSEYLAVVMNLNKISFWEKPGDDTDFPRIQTDNDSFLWGGVKIDRMIEKVNWLKIKTLSVGYTLSEGWIKKCGLGELRIFASGENLCKFTNYSGIEPEIVDFRNGNDAGEAYPLARKLTLGLTLKF